MALPKDVKFVTFDCYGTLIDWETGVYEAFQKEADRDGFTIDREQLVPRFVDIQREIQRGSYELYAEVLRRTAVRVAGASGSFDQEQSKVGEKLAVELARVFAIVDRVLDYAQGFAGVTLPECRDETFHTLVPAQAKGRGDVRDSSRRRT